MLMRMGHTPHQKAKGTRRTEISVHARLSDRRCTERCLLFARTPKRRDRKNSGDNNDSLISVNYMDIKAKLTNLSATFPTHL